MLNIQFDHFEKLKFTGSQKVKLQLSKKRYLRSKFLVFMNYVYFIIFGIHRKP